MLYWLTEKDIEHRSEERRVGKECRCTRWTGDWSSDVCSSDLYFFFSHTIKKQEHNRKLLQAILQKNIRLIDYECLRYPDDGRILGFGRFAGIVGAYNALLAYGKRYRT